MAEIRPFQGVHCNQLLIKDLSQVSCSPYDIITPQLQQELYHRSQYNFIHLGIATQDIYTFVRNRVSY